MILSALLVRPYNPNGLALTPGTRLGVYDITAQIGVGGMGEVYQATDTNLKRQVAIKVLPAAVAGDADRLTRFQREAEVLAALNHPNIAQIFGLEKTPDFTALVMELVEGDDLSQRIARGAVPVDEALPIAKQIAEAVEAAHEQGIIHRDLKPANIKVRPDGTVKVLDFGLAKAMEPAAGSSPSMSMSPTITTPAMTQAGMILGTAAYMSPEQAKGRPADKRSDIWAFGCVLYEMLTGRRAFEGEDLADTLASVLKSPPNWAALPPSLPAGIRTLLMRCLDRDRAKRVADAATVRYVIAEVASLAPGVDGNDVTPRVAQRTAVRPLLLAGALAALLAIGVAVAVWNLQPPAPLQNVTRFSIQVSDLTTVGRNQMAVSPDGTRLVYYRNGQPVLRDLSESDTRIIPPDFGQTAFAPDGRSLAVYRFADRAIKRIGVMSGAAAAVTVCPADSLFGMTWDSTGIISGQGSKGILRCRLDGSAPEQLATVQDGEEADRPQILPGGENLLFTIAKTADGATRWDNARIVVQALKSGERTTLVEGGSGARYVPSGHLLYARGGVVFAAPFDATRQKVTGQAAAVIEGVRRVGGAATGGAQFAVSDTGNLFYIPGPASTATGERMVGLADRAGGVTRLAIPAGPYVRIRVSRDGARLAIESDTGDQAAISIYALGGTGALQRLTLEGRNRSPVWSPDGTRMVFQSDRGGDQAVFVQRVDGTGPAERLTTPANDESHVPESWSRDGRSILVSVVKGTQFSLSVLSLADRKLVPFGVTSTEPIGAVFSPDGRWVAYRRRRPGATTSSAEDGVFVQPFPATGAIYQAPRVGIDFHPVWAPDGNALVYVESAASGNVVTVAVTAQAGLTFGAPVSSPAAVTSGRTSGETRAHDILPDGRFVGLVEVPDTDGSFRNAVREIRVVLNWFEELKRLVPVN